MFSRRHFMEASAATAGASLMPAGIVRSLAATAASAPFNRVVVDERFAASRAFGARAHSLGAPLAAIEGDITDFWYHDLDRPWRQHPLVIAGLTQWGPLFCLERLAWDVGLRVVFRAHHRRRRDGGMDHEIAAGPDVSRYTPAIRLAGAAWPERIADAGIRAFEKRIPAGRVTATTADAGTRKADPNHLYSWIIGPVERGPRRA